MLCNAFLNLYDEMNLKKNLKKTIVVVHVIVY